MSYLLDTDVCIVFLNGTDPAVRERLRDEGPGRVALCSVVKAELLFGARKGKRSRSNLERLQEFFRGFPSLPFEDAAAEVYGRVRAALAETGRPIGPNDLLIASIALAGGHTLVSRNLREFTRVPGLEVEQW